MSCRAVLLTAVGQVLQHGLCIHLQFLSMSLRTAISVGARHTASTGSLLKRINLNVQMKFDNIPMIVVSVQSRLWVERIRHCALPTEASASYVNWCTITVERQAQAVPATNRDHRYYVLSDSMTAIPKLFGPIDAHINASA